MYFCLEKLSNVSENCRAGKFETKEELAAKLAEMKIAEEQKAQDVDKNLGKFKGKKTKLVAKTGKKKQWEIMVSMKVPLDEIPKFVDAEYWLEYFPPYGQSHLKKFGLHTDWRRSFITTSLNPYYDKFIRWQFRKLKNNDHVGFGNRPTIYSISQGQACADHARDEGEGVNPQEYTLIKIKVDNVGDFKKRVGNSDIDAGSKVYLVAATLRPETMYGQTNCFVLPDGDYGCYQMKDGEIFVCSHRSAINMSYQDMTQGRGEIRQLGSTFKGLALLGLALNAPNATYKIVYTLPLLSISMGKGTGVVTSVPSDAPDDYIALRDLQRNENGIRDKFPMITDEMVNFDVVPIISIPGGEEELKIENWGPCAAVTGCEALKVKNQHDKKKLIKIKKAVYNKGFYQGVMQVGSQKGALVQDAKPAVRKEMIANGQACAYWEPESLVISRSGDECIVAFLDQWYLKYGEEKWRDDVINHVQSAFDAYAESSLKQYVNTLNWLGNWACSRNFGLGTKLPWDEQFVIESLSDSTIYMAYYTVAHLLQGENNMNGQKTGPSGITSDELNDAAFDYIYCNGPMPDVASPNLKEQLPKLRHEFLYWYPMDLRVSGKDLIRNHLTMALYNHAGIWRNEPHLWPKSYFTNGHVMVDGVKMSKSKGNFILLADAIETNNVHHKRNKAGDLEWKPQSWSADALRLALADGGDTNDDANFESETANMAILRLTQDLAWITELCKVRSGDDSATISLRKSGTTLSTMDKVFHTKMNELIADADYQYSRQQFKSALKSCFYEMGNARNQYVNYHKLAKLSMHEDVVMRYINAFVVMLSPICSHWSEYVWMDVLGNKTSIMKALWPVTVDVDPVVKQIYKYISDTIDSFRKSLAPPKKKKKKKKGAAPEKPYVKPTQAYVYVGVAYAPWRIELLGLLNQIYENNDKSFPKSSIKELMPMVQKSEQLKAEGESIHTTPYVNVK